jgi:hypothetical protein
VSRWAVEPAGVRSVLVAVQGPAEALEATYAKAPDALDGVRRGVGTLLGQAWSSTVGLLDGEVVRAERIGTRLSACVTGAVEATNAYVQGDEEMAASTQAAAVAAAGVQEP